MSEQWRFDQDDDARWRWTHVRGDDDRTASASTFERPVECFIDAVRHAVDRRRAAEHEPEQNLLDTLHS